MGAGAGQASRVVVGQTLWVSLPAGQVGNPRKFAPIANRRDDWPGRRGSAHNGRIACPTYPCASLNIPLKSATKALFLFWRKWKLESQGESCATMIALHDSLRAGQNFGPQLGWLNRLDLAAEAQRELDRFFFGVEPQPHAHRLPIGGIGGFFFQPPSAVPHPLHHGAAGQEGGVIAGQLLAELRGRAFPIGRQIEPGEAAGGLIWRPIGNTWYLVARVDRLQDDLRTYRVSR